jgi:acyl-CoA reductase-like NAD-dependent aldehyde dehydrogenase
MAGNPAIATYRWSSDRSEDRFPVENPATGQIITVVQGCGVPEVDAVVQAAHRAFQDGWRWRTAAECAGLLGGADVLEAHADELAELVSLENESRSPTPGCTTSPSWAASSGSSGRWSTSSPVTSTTRAASTPRPCSNR